MTRTVQSAIRSSFNFTVAAAQTKTWKISEPCRRPGGPFVLETTAATGGASNDESPMSKMIFLNLPVRDLAAATAFYKALGGELNPQFSGEHSSSMMFSDSIVVMLLTHDHYRNFTQRPIGDARRESQALIALSIDTRDGVDGQIGPKTTIADLATFDAGRVHPLTGPVYVKGA